MAKPTGSGRLTAEPAKAFKAGWTPARTAEPQPERPLVAEEKEPPPDGLRRSRREAPPKATYEPPSSSSSATAPATQIFGNARVKMYHPGKNVTLAGHSAPLRKNAREWLKRNRGWRLARGERLDDEEAEDDDEEEGEEEDDEEDDDEEEEEEEVVNEYEHIKCVHKQTGQVRAGIALPCVRISTMVGKNLVGSLSRMVRPRQRRRRSRWRVRGRGRPRTRRQRPSGEPQRHHRRLGWLWDWRVW